MAKKYTYSRSFFRPDGEAEQFSAVEFDSFDEAIAAVDRGITDRKLHLGMDLAKPGAERTVVAPVPSTPQPSTPPAPAAYNGGNVAPASTASTSVSGSTSGVQVLDK